MHVIQGSLKVCLLLWLPSVVGGLENIKHCERITHSSSAEW